MHRCAFLTTELDGFVHDDELAYVPLRRRGWSVDAVDWRNTKTDWDGYDLVVIRSTWDYHHQPQAFLERLAAIDRSATRLENPIETVRWNYRKTYLLDLASLGVPIVPTLVRPGLVPGDLARLWTELGCDEMVVKPVIGANAEDTYRLDRESIENRATAIEHRSAARGMIAQPLVRSVLDEGEYSVFFFNGEYSHTILKTPRADDFRVQEEHGGTIRAVSAETSLVQAAAASLGSLTRTPLYARVDLARSNTDDTWWLMELELIEPSLYLRMDPEAAERFARAIDTKT